MAAAADAAFVLPIVDDKDMSTWKGVGGSGGAVAAEDGLLFFFRNDNDDAFDVMVKQRKHKQVVVVCGLGACWLGCVVPVCLSVCHWPPRCAQKTTDRRFCHSSLDNHIMTIMMMMMTGRTMGRWSSRSAVATSTSTASCQWTGCDATISPHSLYTVRHFSKNRRIRSSGGMRRTSGAKTASGVDGSKNDNNPSSTSSSSVTFDPSFISALAGTDVASLSPYLPVPYSVARHVLVNVANIQPEDVHYELGSGDGRVNFVAGMTGVHKSVGIEIDVRLVRESNESLEKLKQRRQQQEQQQAVPSTTSTDNDNNNNDDDGKEEDYILGLVSTAQTGITFRQGDLLDDAVWIDIQKEATVVTMYFVAVALERIQDRLEGLLRRDRHADQPPTRIVTCGYPLINWEPVEVTRKNGLQIYLYTIDSL